MLPHKLHIRAALKLHNIYFALATHGLEQTLQDRLVPYQRALERTRTSLRLAVSTGWPALTLPVRRNLHGMVKSIRDAVARTNHDLAGPAATVPGLRSLLDELKQLEEEFGGLQIDFKKKSISVVTEPIELEDVYLGSFSIQLCWSRLGKEMDGHCLEIIALEPNPAASNDGVTHPHVNHGVLCAGDATLPLQNALKQGRLADAFCLVRSVLTHYNSKSPHVSLDNWGGDDCYDCGGRIQPDNPSECGSCENQHCSDCLASCHACEEYYCHGCLELCPLCQAPSCPGCLKRSAHSNKVFCSKCLRNCVACSAQVAHNELDPLTHSCPSCIPTPEPEVLLPADSASSPTQEPIPTETINETSQSVVAVA